GAAVAGMVTSLVLVPLFGASMTLFLFVCLILANVWIAVLSCYRPEKIRHLAPAGLSLRRFGYVLFGVGLSIVLCSNLLSAAAQRLNPPLPQHAAQALAGQMRLERASSHAERNAHYFNLYDANDEPAGYVFSSADLAPEVRGFGGKINLGIYLDTTGALVDFHVIRSNETPAYLALLGRWSKLLRGHRLFEPGPFADVHAVTGATVTCQAILSALQTSAHRFARQQLGRSVEASDRQQPKRLAYGLGMDSIYLLSVFALTLIVIYRGDFWTRFAVLALNVVAGGIVLNLQYSTEQMVTILSLHTPAAALSAAFLLVIGVPLLVLVFGNIYCGYICPFGALQELLGYIVPKKFKQPMPRPTMQKARFVKYVVLLLLIVVFFFSRNRTTLAADPLISIFNLRFSIYHFRLALLLITALALLGSIFYTRFWCRYLCPAGAFLSLFNNVAPLKRYLPAKKFSRCEFGLTAKDNMDCIYCDKCRYEAKTIPIEQPVSTQARMTAKLLSRSLPVAALLFAAAVSVTTVDRFLEVIPAGLEHPTAAAASGGQPRDVDMQRIRTMIEQRKLSEKEAEYYKKVE
ncbi:MAG: 4Fe-4S binding protein, partial [Planctomycetota bacterium]